MGLIVCGEPYIYEYLKNKLNDWNWKNKNNFSICAAEASTEKIKIKLENLKKLSQRWVIATGNYYNRN